jgi:hypothetical protein
MSVIIFTFVQEYEGLMHKYKYDLGLMIWRFFFFTLEVACIW